MVGLDTKVLLIDDEDAFLTALAKRLNARNIVVRTATSGEAGLEEMERDSDIDVVVLDVKMAGMDGMAALKEIKKRYPIVEVVMLTGHATVDSAIEGMKLGAYDYLMKPCDLDQLLAKIQDARSKKQSQQDRILEATGKELKKKKGL
jgi:DNA-binding NtrC family response regulator